MADLKKPLSSHDALTSVADADLFWVTDVSDTSQSVNGTSKKVTAASIAAAQAFATNHVKRVADLAALRAVSGMQANQAVEMVTTGRAGTFRWDDSDLSAEVTADTQMGIYVPPTGQDGSSGAWVRVLSGSVTPDMYGAARDGVTDDSAAFAAALSHGQAVTTMSGTYYVPSLTISGSLRGSGIGRTTLKGTLTVGGDDLSLSGLDILSTASTAITASNRSGLELAEVSVDFDASVASGHLVLDAYQVSNLRVRDSQFRIGGVQMSGCEGFSVSRNRWDCEYLNTAEPVHASAKSHGIVSGNTILRTATDGIDLYASGRRCVVTNNRIDGIQGNSGIEAKVTLSDDPNNTSGETLGFVESTIIANNLLRNFVAPSTGTRIGIYAEYVDSRDSPSFDISNTNRALIIQGNILEDFNVTDPAPTLATYWGISFTGHNGLIANNVVRHVRSHNTGLSPCGIKLSNPTGSSCAGVIVSGNVIAGVENYAGIEAGSMEGCIIANNIIRQDEPTSTTPKFGVSFVDGSDVQNCLISGNIFECNQANSFGVRWTGDTGTFSRCTISNNMFRSCGARLAVAEFVTFSGNQCDFAANSQTLSMGTSGTTRTGNKVVQNDFILSDDYAVSMTDQSGFIVSNNTFTDANRPVVLSGVAQHGIVSENVSYSQLQASPVITYSGVTAGDQETISDTGNKII